MVSWLEAQNSDDALIAQAAADTLWGRVQQWRAWQAVLVVAIPAALALTAQWQHDVGVFAAMFGFIMTLTDAIVITPFLVLRRREAAQAQDRFDGIALGSYRPALRRQRDLEESTLRALAASQNRARSEHNRDWYSPLLGQLPHEIGRIACMRESAVWDGSLRRSWASVIAASALVSSIGLILFSIYGGQAAADVLIRVLFPLAPALVWASHEWREQRDAANAIESLRFGLRTAWVDGVARRTNTPDLQRTADEFETELYMYRSATFPIPHFLYSIFRRNDDQSMRGAAEDAVQEYNLARSTTS